MRLLLYLIHTCLRIYVDVCVQHASVSVCTGTWSLGIVLPFVVGLCLPIAEALARNATTAHRVRVHKCGHIRVHMCKLMLFCVCVCACGCTVRHAVSLRVTRYSFHFHNRSNSTRFSLDDERGKDAGMSVIRLSVGLVVWGRICLAPRGAGHVGGQQVHAVGAGHL